MKNKTFDELINETTEVINQLSSTDIAMNDAMELFETGVKNLQEAKIKLQENKTKIQKILEDNSVEDLEE